jgi:hypothetical protein
VQQRQLGSEPQLDHHADSLIQLEKVAAFFPGKASRI